MDCLHSYEAVNTDYNTSIAAAIILDSRADRIMAVKGRAS